MSATPNRFSSADPRIEKIPESGCWVWMRSLNRGGYGLTYVPVEGRARGAHIPFFVAARGPVPEGMYLDHVCRVRSCVNPDHLRVVTPRENAVLNSLSFSAVNAAKTHCPHGHPFAGSNLRIDARGMRECLTCRKDSSARLSKGAAQRKRERRMVNPVYAERCRIVKQQNDARRALARIARRALEADHD